MLFRVGTLAVAFAVVLLVYPAGGFAANPDAAAADGETSGTSGIVLDPEGNPVPEADIKMFLMTPEKQENIKIVDGQIMGMPAIQQVLGKETDSEGKFQISPLAKGVGVLTVNQPPYTFKIMPMQLPDPNLRIQLENNSASVHGIVRNVSTGQPVAGARVVAMPMMDFDIEVMPDTRRTFSGTGHSLRVQTDASGQYTIDRLPPGTSVTLEAATNDLVGTSDSASANTVVLNAGENGAGPELQIYPGHTLTGRVIDADTGFPIPGAQVTVGFGGGGKMLFSVASGRSIEPAVTDAEGKYTLPFLKPWKGGIKELADEDKINFMFVVATAPGYGQTRFTPTAARQFDPSALTLHHDFELKPRSR